MSTRRPQNEVSEGASAVPPSAGRAQGGGREDAPPGAEVTSDFAFGDGIDVGTGPGLQRILGRTQAISNPAEISDPPSAHPPGRLWSDFGNRRSPGLQTCILTCLEHRGAISQSRSKILQGGGGRISAVTQGVTSQHAHVMPSAP